MRQAMKVPRRFFQSINQSCRRLEVVKVKLEKGSLSDCGIFPEWVSSLMIESAAETDLECLRLATARCKQRIAFLDIRLYVLLHLNFFINYSFFGCYSFRVVSYFSY